MNYQEEIDTKLAQAEAALGAPLTEKERKRFQSYTVGAILGVKLIESLSSEELKDALRDKDKHEALRQRVGKGTNPSWVTGQVAEALWQRNEITDHQFDFINENGGLVMVI
jgi:hypothetical protein